jgi:vancomycin resistance protein YoaR
VRPIGRNRPSLRTTLGLAAALAAWSATFPVALSASTAPEPEEFPVVLGSFSTTLVGSIPARTENVRRAAEALDRVVLAPGEVLSFNRQVGPRTLERGYQSAPVILRETRQAQLGGGICQVASTLFDAALVAGLSPVERWRHSTPVDYVSLGQDATISWGVKDLRLLNDLEQRVRVRAEVLGTTLTFRIEGESEMPDRYELETVEGESIPGAGVAGGREVELYRTHRRDGETVARELVHRDVYPPSQPFDPGSGR